MQSHKIAWEQLQPLLVSLTEKQTEPELSFLKLRSDYLQLRQDADKIFNIVGDEESKEPQDLRLAPQMLSELSALLHLTEEKLSMKKEKLQSKVREIQTDAQYLQEKVMCSNKSQLAGVQTTFKASERKISLIRGRLEANDKIFADLRANLVNCIKKANDELDRVRPPQPLPVSTPVIAQIPAPLSAPVPKKQGVYSERLSNPIKRNKDDKYPE